MSPDVPVRLLIFGLRRSDDTAELMQLFGAGAAAVLELRELPGEADQVYGVLNMPPGVRPARQLADHVNHCQHHGRRLQAWVPVMPWR